MQTCQNAMERQLAKVRKLWTPPPKLSLSEWSERNAYLSAESAAQPGKWHNIPYQIGMQDAVTDPSVEIISVLKSARIGYTKSMINNTIGYHIHGDPCPILVVQPTIDDAQGYSKDEVSPMFRDTPCLAPLVPDVKTRDSSNTIMRKEFPGGVLLFAGANSARGFRRISARVVIFDEVDGYPPTAGQEGDQILLGMRRADYFWNKKIIIGSTPTVKGVSRVEEWYLKGDQRHYYVPCPHCGHMQTLEWSNFDFSNHGTPRKPVYICAGCEQPIEYKSHRWMIERGEWRAHAEFRGHASFYIWAAYSYSPNATWRHIVEAFLAAKDNREMLKTWVNTWLGQTWEEEGEELDQNALSSRRENFGVIMPLETAILTAAVDIQADRFEILVKAWGANEESWNLEHIVIHGNPKQPEVWDRLDQQLQKPYQHMNGSTYHIHAAAIDTGYQPSPLVYEFCRKRQMRNVFAVKGANVPTKPITPPKPSRRNKGNVNLYEIGVSVAKDLLFARLTLKKPEQEGERCPGYIHFPSRFSDNYFEQLTAERKVLRHNKGRPYYEWKNQPGKRNEAIDLEVYSIAAVKLICPDIEMLNRYVAQAAGSSGPAPVVQNKRKSTKVDIWG